MSRLFRILSEFFTWWNGQNLGTRLFTWRKGIFVGEDSFGNRYYRQRNGKRRWVIYAGVCEASSVPPKWNAWLQKRRTRPPSEEAEAHAQKPAWLKDYIGNQTGTENAYRPHAGEPLPPPLAPDYTPWRP